MLCDQHTSRLAGAIPTLALERKEQVGEGKGVCPRGDPFNRGAIAGA